MGKERGVEATMLRPTYKKDGTRLSPTLFSTGKQSEYLYSTRIWAASLDAAANQMRGASVLLMGHKEGVEEEPTKGPKGVQEKIREPRGCEKGRQRDRQRGGKFIKGKRGNKRS